MGDGGAVAEALGASRIVSAADVADGAVADDVGFGDGEEGGADGEKLAAEVGVEAGGEDDFALFEGVNEMGDDERGEELEFIDADDLGVGEMGFEGVDVIGDDVEGVAEEAGAGLDLLGAGVDRRAEADGGDLLFFEDILRERRGKHGHRIKGRSLLAKRFWRA